MIINTQAPTNTYTGFGQLSYGNGDAFSATAAVSGPIVPDKLLFRLAANIKSDGGRITNTYLNANVDKVKYDDSVRGRLLFEPSSDLTVDLRASYGKFNGGATWDSVVFSSNANDIQSPQSDTLGRTTGSITDVTLKIDYKLPFATLTSITGYTSLGEDYRGSLDFSNPVNNPGGLFGLYGPVGQAQNLSDKNISEEIRLTSPSNQKFRWVGGFFFVHEDRSLLTRAWVNSPLSEFGSYAFYHPSESVLNSFAGFDIPSQVIVDHSESNSNDAYAVFGQADYDLNDKVTVTAGLRYDTTSRDQTDVVGGASRSVNFSATQPKATITYHFSPRILFYATASTGFRSGGWNGPGISIPEFKAESTTNYEGGFKTQWFDRRLTFNGDYYYAVDHNFQFFYVQASTGSQIISNLNSVHLQGVELELEAHPTSGLTLFGSLGTTDSNIYRSALYPQDQGDKAPKTIPAKINAGIQYKAQLVEGWEGLARLDYVHKDREYWQIDNLNVQKALDLINARVGVTHGPIGVYVWARNLTDQRYYEDYNPARGSGLPYDIGSLAQPRTFGVEVQARF